MRWGLLLLLVGCGSPQVTDIAFPAVAIDADGAVRGYLSAAHLTTTTRHAVERYVGRRVLDREGREYIIEAVKEIDPPGMFSDFAGTKPFQVELTIKRGRKMKPAEAVSLIAETIRKNAGYLDLTEQGRDAVATELGQKATVAEVATLLATTYDHNKVIAESIARENRRVERLAERGE
jgi:hypothetical protein